MWIMILLIRAIKRNKICASCPIDKMGHLRYNILVNKRDAKQLKRKGS